jgi:hypothetical protein
MLKVEELKELIKTILFSGYVSKEKPLSIIFVADVGSGKSEILNSFKLNDNIAYFTDVTYMGLIKLLENEKEVRHIVIPDFLKITMKKKSTTDNITSCFNAMMEEGLEKISMMGQSYDFKGKKLGLITATTRNSFNQYKNRWASMGFLSRMLIISYKYSEESVKEIFEYIYNREYLKNGTNQKENMPIRNIDVVLSPKLARKLKDKKTDFRRQKQLQTLAMSRALMDNRDKLEVIEEDIKKVNSFKKFLNLNFIEI